MSKEYIKSTEYFIGQDSLFYGNIYIFVACGWIGSKDRVYIGGPMDNRYSVMQSDGNIYWGDVVKNSLNM